MRRARMWGRKWGWMEEAPKLMVSFGASPLKEESQMVQGLQLVKRIHVTG